MRDRKTSRNIVLMFLLVGLALSGSACVVATKQNVRRARAFYTIGVKQSNQGQFRQALASLKRAEELNPNSYWIHEALGVTFHRMGRSKMALNHYIKAVDILPKSPRGNNNLGAAYMSLGQWKNSIKYFKIALKNMLYQTPCFARANIAWSYHKLKEYKESDKFFTLVTRTCPKVCQVHRLRGLAAHERNNHKQANASFQQLRKRCKKYIPGYFFLARSQVALKDFDNARGVLNACVDKGDKHPRVQSSCRELLKKIPKQKVARPNPIAAPKSPKEKQFIYIKPAN